MELIAMPSEFDEIRSKIVQFFRDFLSEGFEYEEEDVVGDWLVKFHVKRGLTLSKNDLSEFIKMIGALGFEVPRIYPIKDVHGLEVVDRGGAYFIDYGDKLSQTFVKSVKKRLSELNWLDVTIMLNVDIEKSNNSYLLKKITILSALHQ